MTGLIVSFPGMRLMSLSLGLGLCLDFALTLLRLSALVRAMGSESLLRRRRERGNLDGEERGAVVMFAPLLLFDPRAWMARGEMDREEVAVLAVRLQGLGFLMAELGVLARWMGGLWRR